MKVDLLNEKGSTDQPEVLQIYALKFENLDNTSTNRGQLLKRALPTPNIIVLLRYY